MLENEQKKNYKLQSSNDSKKGKTKNGKLNVFHCSRNTWTVILIIMNNIRQELYENNHCQQVV